jgi:hypothetical protein
MIRLAVLGFTCFVLITDVASAQTGAACDRDCLRSTLTRYLNAVVKNAPADAGIIAGFRQTENAEVKRVGTGVWASVTALGTVQRYYMDPVSEQAAYFGLVEDYGKPAIVSVRIKVVGRQITEAEWYIGREGQPGMAGDPAPDGTGAAPYDPVNFMANPPPPERNVPAGKRLSRESLLGVTNSYFDAITAHEPEVMLIHRDCQRIENGRHITGRPLPSGSDDGYQGKTNCSSGIRATGRLNVALVTARRYPVVDEEQQVVLGLGVFLRSPESVNRRLGLSEFFHIDDGLISAVHAALFYAAPDQPIPNWPPYDGHFPLPAVSR